ncbi:expressed unknown protein [Seminavis robusta]|uniref:Uncharacterized protein n=1 Tax=Seminavis robusta TaxID=568900 RepID=A0A9N8H599_9STRA|nr:expressed unknown protein [Seminavis robusta]|eukprot:Sro108_g054160.1 n/a (347) ;mRNA; f:47351-48391
MKGVFLFLIGLFCGVVGYVSIISRLLLQFSPAQPCTTTTDTTNHHHHHATTPSRFHSRLRFVMVVGLEGTGHHFMGQIAKHAPPLMTTLKELGLIRELRILQKSLFDHFHPTQGLWNAHCALRNATTINMATLQDTVVQQLAAMEQQYTQQQKSTATSVIHVPLNTAFDQRGVGMMSYPNFYGNCRKLNYPSLELLYRACDLAQVDCGHVYLDRSPSALLYSTTRNRQLGSGSLAESLHLYKSMYHIVESQLRAFASRTWGCFELFHNDNNNNNNNQQQQLGQLWGYPSDREFSSFWNQTYKPPQPVPPNWIPPSMEPSFDAVQQAHQRVWRVCQQAYRGTLRDDD